jgi:hypothetical protein
MAEQAEITHTLVCVSMETIKRNYPGIHVPLTGKCVQCGVVVGMTETTMRRALSIPNVEIRCQRCSESLLSQALVDGNHVVGVMPTQEGIKEVERCIADSKQRN